jgi:hypothetical protein
LIQTAERRLPSQEAAPQKIVSSQTDRTDSSPPDGLGAPLDAPWRAKRAAKRSALPIQERYPHLTRGQISALKAEIRRMKEQDRRDRAALVARAQRLTDSADPHMVAAARRVLALDGARVDNRMLRARPDGRCRR